MTTEFLGRLPLSGNSEAAVLNMGNVLNQIEKAGRKSTYAGVLAGYREVVEEADRAFRASGRLYTATNYSVSPRLLHLRIVDNEQVNVSGEDLHVGVNIRHTGFGERTTEIDLLVFKVICANGMITTYGSGQVFKVQGKSAGNVKDDLLTVIGQLPGYMEYVRANVTEAKKIRLSRKYLNTLIQNFRSHCEDDQKLVEEIELRIGKYGGRSLWSYANAITEVAQDFTTSKREKMERYAGTLVEHEVMRKSYEKQSAVGMEKMVDYAKKDAEMTRLHYVMLDALGLDTESDQD